MPQDKDKKSKKWWIIGGAIIVIAIIVGLFMRSSKNGQVTATVKRQDIRQVVRITGKVAPFTDAALAFERGGKVNYIGAEVGKSVQVGDLLMALEASDISAEISQYEATVKAEQAKLDQLQRGSTPQQIDVYETKLTNALIAVENAKKTAADAIESTFTQADDAVRNKIDPMFTNPRSMTPQFNLVVDTQLKTSIENTRIAIETILTNWPNVDALIASGANASSTAFSVETNYLTYLGRVKTNLSNVRSFTDTIAKALATVVPSSQTSQSAIDNYKAAILTARTNINTAISSISSAEESLRNDIAAAGLARSELTLNQTPARAEEISAQEARVDQAKANVENARARFGKTRLVSPLQGIVTEKNIELGEIVAANQSVMKVISTEAFKVEANIPESEIAGVKVGDNVLITLDAYPEASLGGAIVLVDPAEIIVDGVKGDYSPRPFTGQRPL